MLEVNMFILFVFSAISTKEIVVAIVGYAIVFIALVSLYTLFRYLPSILSIKPPKKRASKSADKDTLIEKNIQEDISGEEIAAIAMSLHLIFNEMHDEESGVLTIKKISKAYSPWSSKIYAVRNQFNRI